MTNNLKKQSNTLKKRICIYCNSQQIIVQDSKTRIWVNAMAPLANKKASKHTNKQTRKQTAP